MSAFDPGTDIETPSRDVRYTPKNRHRLSAVECLLCAPKRKFCMDQ